MAALDLRKDRMFWAMFFTILGLNLLPSIPGRSSVLTSSYFWTRPSKW